MDLRDIVNGNAIVPALESSTRDEVIAELVDSLIAAGVAGEDRKDEIMTAILDRERKGSTGFGKGVAIPHVKLKGVDKMSAAIGVSSDGIDFNALDKQPVYSVFVLISPADDPEQHLKAMEVIFKNLSKESFRRFLRQAGTREDVQTLLEDADNDRLVG